MAKLPQNCCCCLSLKTGVIILGSLGIVSYTKVLISQHTTEYLHDLQIGSLIQIPISLLGYDSTIQQQAEYLGYEGNILF
jgi:hypothetical protein